MVGCKTWPSSVCHREPPAVVQIPCLVASREGDDAFPKPSRRIDHAAPVCLEHRRPLPSCRPIHLPRVRLADHEREIVRRFGRLAVAELVDLELEVLWRQFTDEQRTPWSPSSDHRGGAPARGPQRRRVLRDRPASVRRVRRVRSGLSPPLSRSAHNPIGQSRA